MIYAFLVFILLIVLFDVSTGCKCVISNNTKKFCEAKWVSRARVLSLDKVEKNKRQWRIYNLKHIETFKIPNLTNLLNLAYTIPQSEACGVPDLQINKEYLLAGTISEGTNLHILLCLTFVKGDLTLPLEGTLEWKDVPDSIREILITQKNRTEC